MQVLDEVFKALASSQELSQQLIYKGARVLRLRLQEFLRASFDIDASLATFAANVQMASDERSREQMRSLVHRVINDYFEAQDLVRYQLERSTIINRRKTGPHPRGWDVYWLELHVRNLAGEGAAGTGSDPLRIDIAAAELWSDRSLSPLDIDGRTVSAVTLERIAGEKLRAFLSSLPYYRKKIHGRAKARRAEDSDGRRVKDLYDLVRIARRYPVTDGDFWQTASTEFRLACQSRCIDCGGYISFRQGWDETRQDYEADRTLPDDVSFEQVEETLDLITDFLIGKKVIPFYFDLPEIDEDEE